MPDLAFVALKMAVTAAFVVTAARITERLGPAIGALVATLPVSAGPGLLFLSLDHGAAFMAESLRAGLSSNTSNMLLVAIYCRLAQASGPALSLLPTLVICTALSVGLQRLGLSLPVMLVINIIGYALARLGTNRFRDVQITAMPQRWYDLPMRAALVATLIGLLVSTSTLLGPSLSGVLATFPVVLTSLILILHPRAGGKLTAAVIAHTLEGLLGFGVALAVASVVTAAHGSALGLSAGLGVALVWNFGLLLWKRRRAA